MTRRLAWQGSQLSEGERREGKVGIRTAAGRGSVFFLADASMLLASSLDLSSTLAGVVQAAVPRVADWCILELEELVQGGLPPLAVHADHEAA